MQNVSNQVKNRQSNNLIPFIPDGDFYFTKGVEAFQKRKFEIALKWMNKAVEAKPRNPLFLCQLSVIYTEIGSYHKANQLLTQVLQSSGEDYVDSYYLLANNYAHLGLLNDAKKYADLYLEKDPDGDFVEEANDLLTLIDMDEDDDEDWGPLIDDEDELLVYQETAFYHLEHEEWDKAIMVLEEMLTLFPDYHIAKHEYAFAIFNANRQEEALEMEIDLLEELPNNLNSRTNLALFYYLLDAKEVSNQFLQGLEHVYPIHEQQKLRLAITFARTENYQEAYKRFRLLDKSKVKGHISYYQWYSVAAYHIGEGSKAETIWKEGCKNHPTLPNKVEPWKA
ncbi:tetratricopeptide repeat protein [Ornithinibacillus halophilus]|uniref:Tetratricopeptide repeat-containing protein n=1 Tax=Ornithinibacillus halophilus TaxID=930117 RepID=A0A1M5F277_9BACI|nr:tetratricopeptide repeat protein [Ornithinibacillus halophilus]SHF85262.1 Tetratricopeptide repeat-containing protein [Ornithinibacillus halophilus]